MSQGRKRARFLCALLAALGLALGGSAPARAQSGGPDDLLNQIGFDQQLGAQAPLDLPFRDENGAAVQLGDYFGQKPVVLVLAYYQCPNVCSVALHQLSDALSRIAFDAGQQFNVVAVSIDPSETTATTAAKKAEILASYGRPADTGGWHFLFGAQQSIRQLAQTVGFRYAYDPIQHQFAHPIGNILLTPQGRISRYFYGLTYDPRDMRLGLIEASDNKIGSPIDQLLLRCYHYDPATGKYDLVIMDVIRLACVATVVFLGMLMLLMFRRDRWHKPAQRG
ncbi:MAG: SCO family protein [Roseiflexaceae bacterium]